MTADSLVKTSLFETLETYPPDSHHALKEIYTADPHDPKVILGAGVYRDDNSKPWVLPSVEQAEKIVRETQTSGRYDYLATQGYAPFISAARQVLFGTGANSIGAQFLARAVKPSAVWLPDPTWVNHITIWDLAGVNVRKYPYWEPKQRKIDFDAMISALETETTTGDVILLHACAHNPTGVDPTKEQWKKIADVCESRKLFPFFDCAYQGFASGDLDEDAWAVRHFMERGTMEMFVAQSFSKNMGLYGERVGAGHLICATPKAADSARGLLCRIQRGQVSRPSAFGAKLAATVILDAELRKSWITDLNVMSDRIMAMRKALYEELVRLNTPGEWGHIVSQIGMFSYTGLAAEQVAMMQKESHVYVVSSGRISIAGLTSKNVKIVAAAMDSAIRATQG
ncbi:hypothetical protein PWT90_01915 [Aphanocladium album]|nr:hypothetical protein PWT90_01915 [Aphanocladium album]